MLRNRFLVLPTYGNKNNRAVIGNIDTELCDLQEGIIYGYENGFMIPIGPTHYNKLSRGIKDLFYTKEVFFTQEEMDIINQP